MKSNSLIMKLEVDKLLYCIISEKSTIYPNDCGRTGVWKNTFLMYYTDIHCYFVIATAHFFEIFSFTHKKLV